jgi:hypothetical protein
MKVRHIIFAAFCLMVLLTAPTQAAVLKVGASEQYKTPQEAVNAAKDFDTVRIEPGTYRSDKAINVSGRKGLTIEGAGAGKVQLIVTDLYTDVIRIYRCDGVRIAGVSARHAPTTENVMCAGAVIDVQHATNIAIVDCELNGCGAAGVSAVDSQNVSIVRNNIHHNSYAGLWLIRVTGTVQDNLIANNTRAFAIVNDTGLVFRNNTLDSNGPRSGPLVADDFILKGVRLGDTLAAVTAKLGNPAKISQVDEGFSYDFNSVEVVIGKQNTAVNLLTDVAYTATIRGIRPGSGLGEVIGAYGENYAITELGNLALYEYGYQTPDRGEYVLRFAVDRTSAKVIYIGCRAKSTIEAPAAAH